MRILIAVAAFLACIALFLGRLEAGPEQGSDNSACSASSAYTRVMGFLANEGSLRSPEERRMACVTLRRELDSCNPAILDQLLDLVANRVEEFKDDAYLWVHTKDSVTWHLANILTCYRARRGLPLHPRLAQSPSKAVISLGSFCPECLSKESNGSNEPQQSQGNSYQESLDTPQREQEPPDDNVPGLDFSGSR